MKIAIANSNPIYMRFSELVSNAYNVQHLMSKEELSNVDAESFDYIFFPHWSWKIPQEIFSRTECVLFHMTDLPFGKGGSPLQNLIVRGIYETKVSAIRVVEELDGGPVYMKEDLSLHGTAEEIFLRMEVIMARMINQILSESITPAEQMGKPTFFKRRRKEEGKINDLKDLDDLFDYIRMLDAEGYPHAFLDTEYFRLEFTRASKRKNCLITDVRITKK